MNQPKFQFALRHRGATGPVSAVARVPMYRRALGPNRSTGWQAAVVMVLVVALHGGALYLFGNGSTAAPPQVSVPLREGLMNSIFVTPAKAEPAPARTIRKPPPAKSSLASRRAAEPIPAPPAVPEPIEAARAAAPAPDVADSQSAEAEPRAISAPRFDAAYLANPVPAYPSLSRRLGEEGRVLVRVFVAPDGRAREVHVARSSGYARLDRAAREVVARWRFLPARQGDQPVGAWVVVPISFALKQG